MEGLDPHKGYEPNGISTLVCKEYTKSSEKTTGDAIQDFL